MISEWKKREQTRIRLAVTIRRSENCRKLVTVGGSRNFFEVAFAPKK
jgi:hypothetical protein